MYDWRDNSDEEVIIIVILFITHTLLHGRKKTVGHANVGAKVNMQVLSFHSYK